MSNNLTTSELKKYRTEVYAQLLASPTTDGATLKTALDAFDDLQREARYGHIVANLKNTTGLYGVTGGIVSLSVTISTAGTGYVVGDTFTITGGDGSGGGVKVTEVDGSGAITAVEVTNQGAGYTTPVTDLSGKGDANGALTLSASAVTARNQSLILTELLAETYP